MAAPGGGRRVAVLAPMRSELRPLMGPLGLGRSRSGDDELYAGAIGRLEIVAALTGIGTRAAARAAERVLDAGAVERVVVVGIAGGIGPDLAIGDLVVPELVVDVASGARHRPTPLGRTEPRGTLATSDALIVEREAVARLAAQGVVAVDMETAAVAAVCERRGCPWSVFRAISDRADDGAVDAAVLGLAAPDGGPNLPALVRFLLTRPWRVPRLARLARGMRLAADRAASAASGALARL